MRLSDKVGLAGIVAILAIAVGGGYGWVCNIIALYHSSFPPFTGQLVLRVVGVFIPPVGAVMGYL